MNNIQVLDQITIDKIAAGEVIERPASIVKELVENAIDAKATAITVEIQDGGITLIRVTDNGIGIPKEQVRDAFLRHSTSKIRSVEDLEQIATLGFRGEALSSIAAVSQVELLTKTGDALLGTRYLISGGKEEKLEDAGVPDGTTFLVRQLFYNTPARRKFLRTPMTEASHVGELMTRLSLSHPEISFTFRNNGQTKIQTSGNGNLKDVIYRLFGREMASHIIPVDVQTDDVRITGFLGEPMISRGNRNYEIFFVNQRYIRSSIISKAIEDAYKDYTMQHKFPFVVLLIETLGEQVDVNVHPTKMEVRFFNQQKMYQTVFDSVLRGLRKETLIPEIPAESIPSPLVKETPSQERNPLPSTVLNRESVTDKVSEVLPQKERTVPAENGKCDSLKQREEKAPSKDEDEKLDYFLEKMRQRVTSYHQQSAAAEVKEKTEVFQPEKTIPRVKETVRQQNLFEDHYVEPEISVTFHIVGQVFDTYWIIEYENSMYIIDQHAAHERVLYEKTLQEMKERTHTSQMILPPILLQLSMQEEELLKQYMEQFTRIGFSFEEFGGGSYSVRSVPANLFSIAKKELLMEMLDDLSEECVRNRGSALIDEKIASLSCKAAVKGNQRLSVKEVETLIGELLGLENPFHCPHGRPTIIAMTKRELEKKFKRIV